MFLVNFIYINLLFKGQYKSVKIFIKFKNYYIQFILVIIFLELVIIIINDLLVRVLMVYGKKLLVMIDFKGIIV